MAFDRPGSHKFSLMIGVVPSISTISDENPMGLPPFKPATVYEGPPVPTSAFVAVILNVLLPGRNLKKQPLAAGGAEAVVAVEGKPANVPGAALPGDGSGAVPEALGLVEDEEATAQRS